MEKETDEQALPQRCSSDGSARRVGIELEFAGLSEGHAANIIADVASGEMRWDEPGDFWRIETPCFGSCEVYLDTRFRDDMRRIAGENALDLARLVVPVELVTAPFDPLNLRRFNEVVTALRRSGAHGSRHGLLLGFGVHLNVEIADENATYLWRVATSYALLEAYLRAGSGIDVSRRILPFVAPFPDRLVDTLVEGPPKGLEALIELYLHHSPTRNRGLDMLPVFTHLAPNSINGRIEDGTPTKPRPAFHFRLPDCRINEPDWSIFNPWNSWLAVERLSAAPALFERLRTARLSWRDTSVLSRRTWAETVSDLLHEPQMAEATP